MQDPERVPCGESAGELWLATRVEVCLSPPPDTFNQFCNDKQSMDCLTEVMQANTTTVLAVYISMDPVKSGTFSTAWLLFSYLSTVEYISAPITPAPPSLVESTSNSAAALQVSVCLFLKASLLPLLIVCIFLDKS